MGSLTPHANSAFEEFGCKSCLCSSDCEETCGEHDQCTSSSTENIFRATPLPDIDIFSTSQDADLTVQELGIALNGILHVHDVCEAFGSNPTSNKNDICKQKEMQSRSLDTNILDISKRAAFLCSEVVQSYPLTFDAKEGLSSTVVHIDNLLKAEDPTYACSTTLPTTLKLVSAMKGSRAQQGMPLKTKLSVKWAPEVYDPPVTSESHTVKGQRRKPKKDHHKHKHTKGKSSRGSGGDRNHTYRRSSGGLIDPRMLRLRALNDGLVLNDISRSKLEVMDYAARSQESKFGSSCYMAPLPKLHVSVAEAS